MNLAIERKQIACVFGLGGGELHEPDERFPDEWVPDRLLVRERARLRDGAGRPR
jgi:hypothetical protein